MSTLRRVAIVATLRFERALEALVDCYDNMQHLHPDAGSTVLRLLDLVENELPQLLSAHPDIGRPAQLSQVHGDAESAWLKRLAPLTAARRLQAREWLLGDFWILYYSSANAVYLASARHMREAGYW